MRKPSSALPSERRVSRALESFVRSVLDEHGDEVLSIVLFGSRARGDFTCYSDADVLVVLAESGRRLIDRLSDFAAYCSDGLVEPIVYTREEIEAMFEARNPFLLDVLHEGLPLFDRGLWAELRARFDRLVEEKLVERCGPGWRIRG